MPRVSESRGLIPWILNMNVCYSGNLTEGFDRSRWDTIQVRTVERKGSPVATAGPDMWYGNTDSPIEDPQFNFQRVHI